jgi:hypothetical protein
MAQALKKQEKWMTSRQHLRVTQFWFRAEKARFPCENLDFSGLNQKLRGSQIRREVLQLIDTFSNSFICLQYTVEDLDNQSIVIFFAVFLW